MHWRVKEKMGRDPLHAHCPFHFHSAQQEDNRLASRRNGEWRTTNGIGFQFQVTARRLRDPRIPMPIHATHASLFFVGHIGCL